MNCPECKKIITEDSKFCSHCGVEIISGQEWMNRLANMVIATIEDISDYSGMLKNLGFKGEITEKMKIEKLIWRMFSVNLVIQETTNKEEVQNLNDTFHATIAEKMYKSEAEVQNFLNLIKPRYTEYYATINSKSDQKMYNLGSDFLDFLIFGKTNDNEYPNSGKILFAALAIAEDFANFTNFVRKEYFNQ